MNISFNNNNLKKLQRKAEELHGQKQVPLTELLTDNFIRQYTDFQTLQAMVSACGIEQMEKRTEDFVKFISTHTHFNTWEEMLKAASIAYTKSKLGL